MTGSGAFAEDHRSMVLRVLQFRRNDLLINVRVVTVVLRHEEASRAPSIVLVRVNQFGHVPAVLIDPIDRKGTVVDGIWLGADLDDHANGTLYIRVRTGKWGPRTARRGAPELIHLICRCKTCGKEARFRRNPFFGRGLSVHEFIIECAVYSHVELVRTPALSTLAAPLAVENHARRTRRRRFLFSRAREAD